MPIENERKYHMEGVTPTIFKNRLTNLSVVYGVQKITQHYIARDSERGYVERIRGIQYEDDTVEYIQTQKIGFGEEVHEVETILNEEQYNELLEYFTIGDAISKTRYAIPMNNGTKWEVDVFSGKHKGTIVAEIELPTPDTEIVFLPVLGHSSHLVDVTNDKKFKNWYMAGI